MKTKNIYMLTLLAGITLPAMAQSDIADSVAYKDQTVDIGRPDPCRPGRPPRPKR